MMGWEEVKKEELDKRKKIIIETIERCKVEDFRFVGEMYIRAIFQKCEMDVREEMGMRV